MRYLLPCPPCGRQGRPGKGFLAGFIEKPRGSAPRERDHRGGDHPVPSRTRQLSPPSPRVLQRQAAGGQGVALAEGAFLCARRMRREGPAGGSPLRASPRYGEVAASRAAQSALRRIRPPPGIVGRAGTAGGGVVPCGPLRVLGHCPAGRSDRRRAPGRRLFYLYEAPARFAGPGRVPSRGIAPCGSFCIRRPFAAGESARGLLAGPVLRTACSGGSAWAPMRAF